MDFSSRPIFDDVVRAPATLAASLSALSLGSIGKGIDGTQTNLLVVLNALRRYEVPLIQLQLIGVTKPRAADGTSATGSSLDIPVMFDYNLGGGYSARVIQHKVMEDVIDAETEEVVVKAGIVVALKKIAATPRAGDADGVKAASEAYQSILQEIKISRHPFLRQHENINNLFFVAWADHEAFPLIALELADYGTLEDVLTVPGEGPTHNQKLNLTIDVSLGLAALHHVDIVHGDLKPANILVQHHPQRHIVAQISDFGGSAILSDGEKRPRNLTRLWWAPEVDFEMDSIDWKRADVWSYGLIVASIWNHVPSPEKRTSSCYLNMIISEFLEGRERDDRLQILKTEPDSNPASLMIRAQVELDIVNRILRNSLSSINSKRKSIQDLITDEMTGMSVEAGRRSVHSMLRTPSTLYIGRVMTDAGLGKRLIAQNHRHWGLQTSR
jgi:serine/threonine protein kinase